MKSTKLQKYLADLGLGSRREIETWIEAGRLSVNGERAHIGQRVMPEDKIKLDDKEITHSTSKDSQAPLRVIAYYKPIGKVCTRSDEKGRPNVFEDLPSLDEGRWIMVGRLDINTAGLLLFTNNGEFAHQLMHPSNQIEREYAVRVFGSVSPDIIERLLEGVMLEDGMAKFKSIEQKGGNKVNQWFHVILTRGKNREVRRLWNSQGIDVNRLIRVRFGSMLLPKELVPGKTMDLSSQQIDALFTLLK